MGSGFLTSPSPDVTFTEIFNAQCPYYLSVGMPYELYWRGDCTAVRHFREADKLSRKRKNAELWLQGLYVYEAVADLVPVLRPFAKSGTAPREYPSEPYPVDKADLEVKKKREEEAEAEKTRARLEAWAAAVNAQFKEKEVGEDGGRTDGADQH